MAALAISMARGGKNLLGYSVTIMDRNQRILVETDELVHHPDFDEGAIYCSEEGEIDSLVLVDKSIKVLMN